MDEFEWGCDDCNKDEAMRRLGLKITQRKSWTRADWLFLAALLVMTAAYIVFEIQLAWRMR